MAGDGDGSGGGAGRSQPVATRFPQTDLEKRSQHPAQRRGRQSGCWVPERPRRRQVRSHLHPTAPVHQPKPWSALNSKCFCIFLDVNKRSSLIHLRLTLGEVKIILFLEDESWLAMPVNLQVFS